MIYGELGRYPLSINLILKSIRFWLRILKMPHNRLPYKSYKMLIHLHERNKNTWASAICSFLYKHGFQEVWENQGVANERCFLQTLRSVLILNFKAEWLSDTADKERFHFYRTFKNELILSSYLQITSHLKARISLIRLRLGVSQINTHKMRFRKNIPESELLCPLCKSQIETEVHFVLQCPNYSELRAQYIPAKYYNCPSLFKLTLLLASENKSLIIRLALFIDKAFRERHKCLLN